VFTWGGNANGQLGQAATATPVKLLTIPIAVKTISAGSAHTLVIGTNDALYAWGLNAAYQLGDGTTENVAAPVKVGIDTDWLIISGGGNHSLAIKSDGTLWAWGSNEFGQLGDGSQNNLGTPTMVGTDTNWIAVSAGKNHTYALKGDGTLWGWGQNLYGQIGNGTKVQLVLVPTQLK
jgi:alpha-tubulin suppressor-like RCC1 family protein